jgi:hypothetical protein
MARFKRRGAHVFRGVGAELAASCGKDGCILLTVTEERKGRNYTSSVRVRVQDIPQVRDVILAARDEAKAWQPPKKTEEEAYVRPGRAARVRGGS